jgi:hypothetical protein
LLHPSLLPQLPSQDKEEERAEDAPDPHLTTFSNSPQGHYIYNNIPRYLSWHLASTISEQRRCHRRLRYGLWQRRWLSKNCSRREKRKGGNESRPGLHIRWCAI